MGVYLVVMFQSKYSPLSSFNVKSCHFKIKQKLLTVTATFVTVMALRILFFKGAYCI